jgi:hypothetical protein
VSASSWPSTIAVTPSASSAADVKPGNGAPPRHTPRRRSGGPGECRNGRDERNRGMSSAATEPRYRIEAAPAATRPVVAITPLCDTPATTSHPPAPLPPRLEERSPGDRVVIALRRRSGASPPGRNARSPR